MGFPDSDSRSTWTPVERPREAARIWDVGSLCLAVGDALDARFNPVTVRGELAGVTTAASGHRYFTLKDVRGQLRCAMFRRTAAGLDFQPREGDAVEVRGRLGVYEARGDLQLVVEFMRRAGGGSLYEQFLRLKERLQTDGLFDDARKRPIPSMPRAIAVVTSLGAAALHDVASALQRRAPHVPVYVFPSSVQGAAAPAELIRAIQAAQVLASDLRIDTLLLVRGGGSLEDLWAFNDEALARAVVGCSLPVVVGVGHESDFTIADLCADVRAPTPTAAAELAARPTRDALEALTVAGTRLERALSRRSDVAAQRLDQVGARLGRPSIRLVAEQARLTALGKRIGQGLDAGFREKHDALERVGSRSAKLARDLLEAHGARLSTSQIRLNLLDPRDVLSRGYAILQGAGGRCVTRVDQVAVGDAMRAVLVDGEVDLTVVSPRPWSSA